MAENLYFDDMTKARMKQWCEENPMSVNNRDKGRITLLWVAARRYYADLVEWLVDEKGASVHRTTGVGRAPLHCPTSLKILSFLLARGADPTVLNEDGWTPLMKHAYLCRPDCVDRLLKEPRVIETTDAQATESMSGSTALHIVCSTPYGSFKERTQIIEMLLCAGSDATILNARNETPLDTLRRCHPYNHTGIALLERAKSRRPLFLVKARKINDANHALAKAIEDAQRKVLASAPTCLQERVREQQQQQQNLLLGPLLPRVELHGPPASDSDDEKEKAAEKFHAVLQYVLHAEEVGETGGMKAELFVELMEMMALRWDPIRRGGEGGGGGAAGGQGQG